MSTRTPAVHSVHIYENDDALVTRLCAIVATSLRFGDPALIIATGDHREQLVRALQEVGIDVRAAVREGRYAMLDAEELLSTFIRDGMPDVELFRRSVGAVLLDARRRADSRGRGLLVFGEMVALLWQEDNKAAALKLEALWNDAMRDVAFHLHCAYPRAGFAAVQDIDSVHDLHTHVVQ